MSIIKYLAILALLLGVGYLILGLNTSYEYTNKISLIASPESAMDFITNPNNLPSWNSNVKDVKKNEDGTYQFVLEGDYEEQVVLKTILMEQDSFIWEGEWMATDWTRTIRYNWKKENVLCSLFIEEKIIGNGFFKTANQAWKIGNLDHHRDDMYDSLKVRVEADYLIK